MQPDFSGKDAAFDLLERTRKAVVNKARIAFAKALLEKGEANADDAHDAFPDGLPDDINPVCLGCVPRIFLKAKSIEKKGHTFSKRKGVHAREITVWQVVSPDAVEGIYSELLDEDVEIEERPDECTGPGTLFDISQDAARM